MALRIKTKIFLGLSFLFLLVIIMGGAGGYYIHHITEESKAILQDNYESVQHARQMMEQLKRMNEGTAEAAPEFEAILQKQELNVTEAGEKLLTQEVRRDFEKIKSGNASTAAAISAKLNLLMDLNLDAIKRKNEAVQQKATRVLSSMALTGMLCLIIALSFVLNFPGYVANPLRILTNSIKQIANKNYDQRLDFKPGDEFGELAEAFNKMAEQLNEYNNSNLAKIMFEKKRIETIINQMNDAIIGLDKNKTILFVNSVAEDLLGISEEEMTDRYAADVASHNSLLRTILDEDAAKDLSIRRSGKDGHYRKESFNVMNEGQTIGEVIILKNITSFKELDTAKTNFIATVSHELKTPIASMQMSLQLLEDKRVGETNEEQQQLIRNIGEDADRLLKITGELLDLTQAETGKIRLNMEKTEVKQIVEYALSAIRFQAEQKNIALRTAYGNEVFFVNADREKTAWVLVNLLSNAVRYSPADGTISITVDAVEDGASFSVCDEGKGIDAKYSEKIFDRYFQVPDGGSSGTGLGLAISKEFIEAQNGTIKMESRPGGGSCFSFTLNT
ncbi:MAG: domain S-box [Bacteroidetes bacterium]|nr:domain S-box [Bacteroidota bacterium]